MNASDFDDLAVALGEISRQLRDRGEPEARALADAFDRVAVRLFDLANDAWRAQHSEHSPPTFPRSPSRSRGFRRRGFAERDLRKDGTR